MGCLLDPGLSRTQLLAAPALPLKRQQQHHRKGDQQGRYTPVDAGVERHKAADHLVLRAAEQRRGDLVANADIEHQQATRPYTGIRLREVHPPETGKWNAHTLTNTDQPITLPGLLLAWIN